MLIFKFFILFKAMVASADNHFEYPQADLVRFRFNNFELIGGILKAIGLKLAKQDGVKVGL